MKDDPNVYVGVDTGVKGAISWLFQNASDHWTLCAKKRKDMTQLDLFTTIEHLVELAGHPSNVFVMIEQNGAVSKGRKACYLMGESTAEWKMACLGTGVGPEMVIPNRWQRLVKLPKKQRTYAERKRDLRQLAHQYYPGEKEFINADTQDAILIARACWLTFGGSR